MDLQITIIGTGYVGLVTGACLAKLGYPVICLDIDEEKIHQLKRAKSPFFEPSLEELIDAGVKKGLLHFTTSYSDAIRPADIIFLCLPTPSLPDGSVDLSYAFSASLNLAPHLQDHTIIVTKSTVPVGTAQQISSIISEHISETATFDVVSNPEFLREGCAVHDCLHPHRVIIGTSSQESAAVLQSLYEPLGLSSDQIIIMDTASAELTKYAANAMLATRISFMNELSALCEKVGADIDAIKHGIGSDRRIGSHFLQAGVGFGGSCFPKDLRALASLGKAHQTPLHLIESTIEVNQLQKNRFLEKVFSAFQDADFSQLTFTILGTAFKPNTDDIRESPALEIIEKLLEAGARVAVFDPKALSNTKRYFDPFLKISYFDNPYEALDGSSGALLITEWNECIELDWQAAFSLMNIPCVFDGRNALSETLLLNLGFYYYRVGKTQLVPKVEQATN